MDNEIRPTSKLTGNIFKFLNFVLIIKKRDPQFMLILQKIK